jgi:hypothetical protein
MLNFIQAGPYGLVANLYYDDVTIQVPAVRADDLLEELGWESVDFVKMDIEGSEVRAIQGMPRLLSREDAPAILFESNGHALHCFGETPHTLLACLELYGYRCYLVQPNRLLPIRSADLQPDCNVDCLALRGEFSDLTHWKVRPSLSLEETKARLLASCSDQHPHVRAYSARALRGADARLLSDSRVVAALRMLSHDSNPAVRAAASWFQNEEASSATLDELHRVLQNREAEITRLQALVAAYERGRYLRAMRALHRSWLKIKSLLKQF